MPNLTIALTKDISIASTCMHVHTYVHTYVRSLERLQSTQNFEMSFFFFYQEKENFIVLGNKYREGGGLGRGSFGWDFHFKV